MVFCGFYTKRLLVSYSLVSHLRTFVLKSESQKEKMEVAGDFVSGLKRVKNYPDFEILADLIPQGPRRFKV